MIGCNLEINLSGIVAIVGNYGSGKTEVSVNLAVNRKRAGLDVRLADLDLVNPYFRTREARIQLEALGVEVVLPPEQYLQRYAFFADPTYATANLVITRVRNADGFADVEIECLGTVTGWQPVGASGTYEVAHVDLYRGEVGVTPSCATSQHLATSNGKFGITVWGTDFYASYGYPAGGNIGSINDVVVPPTPK